MRPMSGGMPYGDPQGPPKPKTYSNLDLIKADTPHTTAKISRMLHQLEFKLQVEKQYQKGIDKMAKLYQADGDKKSRADAESKKVESERKIQLLQTSLKRYKTLHILDDADDDEGGTYVLSQWLLLQLTRPVIFSSTLIWTWCRRGAKRQSSIKASVWEAPDIPKRCSGVGSRSYRFNRTLPICVQSHRNLRIVQSGRNPTSAFTSFANGPMDGGLWDHCRQG